MLSDRTRSKTGGIWASTHHEVLNEARLTALALALSDSRQKTPGVSPGMKASPAKGGASEAGPDF
jgi:hypothetical protein